MPLGTGTVDLILNTAIPRVVQRAPAHPSTARSSQQQDYWKGLQGPVLSKQFFVQLEAQKRQPAKPTGPSGQTPEVADMDMFTS